MKINNIIGVLIAIIVIVSCDFRQTVATDLKTGAHSRGDGLGCDVFLEIDGESEKRTALFFGEELKILFDDIQGFNQKDNKTFPGLSMYIVNEKQDTLQKNLDLLSDLNDGTDIDPLMLSTKFNAVFPYKNEEKYEVHVTIWDKNGDGKFHYKLPFTIEESKMLAITSSEIKYSNIYLWNETQNKPITNENLNHKDTIILILEGLEGLGEENGKVFPVFSMNLIDSKGDNIISNPNLLSKYKNLGINTKSLHDNQLTAIISFSEGEFNNPYLLRSVLIDQLSNNKLEITTKLVVQ